MNTSEVMKQEKALHKEDYQVESILQYRQTANCNTLQKHVLVLSLHIIWHDLLFFFLQKLIL